MRDADYASAGGTVIETSAAEAELEVELEQPTPYFLDLTCIPNLAPVRRDVVEAFARRGERDLSVPPERIVAHGPDTPEAWRARPLEVRESTTLHAGAGRAPASRRSGSSA